METPTARQVPAGTHHWPAQQRVIYGVPYREALARELERSRARRVFVTTTRSLTGGNLVAGVVAELGERFAGKFHDIAAHSPREAVIAGARAIRAADTDLIVAVGGGSVIDATKVMLIALWRNFESADRLSEAANRIPESSAWDDDPQRAPHDRDPDHAVGGGVLAARGNHRSGAQGQGGLPAPAVGAEEP